MLYPQNKKQKINTKKLSLMTDQKVMIQVMDLDAATDPHVAGLCKLFFQLTGESIPKEDEVYQLSSRAVQERIDSGKLPLKRMPNDMKLPKCKFWHFYKEIPKDQENNDSQDAVKPIPKEVIIQVSSSKIAVFSE